MVDTGTALSIVGMGMGTSAIAILYLTSDRILPEFQRSAKLLSFAVLAFLTSVSLFTLERLFTFPGQEAVDYIAGFGILVGMSLLIRLSRHL